MAIDPVQSITEQRHEAEHVRNLRRVLEDLAALPPQVETPYLTVCIDWRPEGEAPARRAALRRFEQEVDGLMAGRAAHDPATLSLQADIERVRAYLEEDLPVSVQGVVIVACNAAGVFRAVPLGLPVPTSVSVGPTPALSVLARLAEDYPPFMVVLLDQDEAEVLVVNQGRPDRSIDLTGSKYPVHQSQGGWSQKRYQLRAGERIDHFVRTVVEEAQRAIEEAGVEALVMAGDDQIVTNLRDELHQTVREKVVGHIRFSVNAGTQELVDAAMPLVEQAEREREAAAVQAVRDGVGAGGQGVAGPEDVLTALQTGQVMTLVMTDDFDHPGWADYTLPVYGAGEVPKEHPAGGAAEAIVPVPLADELVRLAVQVGADIEIVKTAVPVSAQEQARIPEAGEAQPRSGAARDLDELGGVGAVLRYALADQQPTADL